MSKKHCLDFNSTIFLNFNSLKFKNALATCSSVSLSLTIFFPETYIILSTINVSKIVSKFKFDLISFKFLMSCFISLNLPYLKTPNLSVIMRLSLYCSK